MPPTIRERLARLLSAAELGLMDAVSSLREADALLRREPVAEVDREQIQTYAAVAEANRAGLERMEARVRGSEEVGWRVSFGLGRLQSLMAALSRLVEARGYLLGTEQAADLEIVRQVEAIAAKVEKRRDAALLSVADDLGKVTNLAPDERARIALQQLPPAERLRLIAEQVSECSPDERGAEVANLVRGLAA
jgi:hypothetical protein